MFVNKKKKNIQVCKRESDAGGKPGKVARYAMWVREREREK
jgi:hypothetical protein